MKYLLHTNLLLLLTFYISQPFNDVKDPRVHFLVQGSLYNCIIKPKQELYNNKQLKEGIEWRITVEESGDLIVSNQDETNFHIRKLGSFFLE